MGSDETTSLTEFSDTVNPASRIRAITKEYRVQFMLSQSIPDHTSIHLSGFPGQQLDVGGRSEDITARVIVNAKDLLI